MLGGAYDAWGSPTSSDDDADRFRYTGREWDAETELYYYRARYYDPATGRFLEQDPIGFDAGDANLYRYVGNGPTNYTDPMGLKWWEWVPGLSTAIHCFSTPGGTKVTDYAGCAPTRKDMQQLDRESRILKCEQCIVAAAAKHASDWTGITTGADLTKGLFGLISSLLGVWAIKAGVKGAVGGTITGGVLCVDAAADFVCVVRGAWQIHDVAKEAQARYCR